MTAMTVDQIITCIDAWTTGANVRRENCRECGHGFDLPMKSRLVRCPECRRERAQRAGRRDRGVARPLVKLTQRRDAGAARPQRRQPGRR